MEKHPEIVPIDPQLRANLVLVPLFKENCP
jgi:hypothetical protein